MRPVGCRGNSLPRSLFEGFVYFDLFGCVQSIQLKCTVNNNKEIKIKTSYNRCTNVTALGKSTGNRITLYLFYKDDFFCLKCVFSTGPESIKVSYVFKFNK